MTEPAAPVQHVFPALALPQPAAGPKAPSVPAFGELLVKQARPTLARPQPVLGQKAPPVPALGEILIERKVVTPGQLRTAMDRHWRTRRRLGRVLVELGYATADAILEALSDQLGLPSTRVDSYTVNPEAVSMLPEKVARQHLAFPLLKVGSTLVVAIATPKNLHAIDDLRFASGCGIQTMVALETDILDALDRYYGNQWVPNDQDESSVVVIDLPGPQLDLHDEVAERSAVTLVERIIARASAERASDIHLEPMKTSLRVRFRIDGTFHEVAHLLLALSPAVLARVKVLAGMDIADHRLPQDGRFSATVSGRGLDIRASTYPTIWGEKAVLRLLDRSTLKLQLEGVDLSGQLLASFRDLIRRPEGIILVTGPTGSGKTSTLYAALAELAETGHNITTIEDPVEYWLQGVNQGQTNHKAGFTFARGLRAILRQDPDVIMVGEIRDPETLETAIEASLTGHTVLSTLHTISATATVTRLLEMGLEPYLLASAVSGISAQRLVRRICTMCRKPVPTPERLRSLFSEGAPAQLYRGAGCPDCRGTGFLGRLAVHELLVMTDELRRLMDERASEADVLEAAKRGGMIPLREACLARVRDGETTFEEVLRVTTPRKVEEQPPAREPVTQFSVVSPQNPVHNTPLRPVGNVKNSPSVLALSPRGGPACEVMKSPPTRIDTAWDTDGQSVQSCPNLSTPASGLRDAT